MDEPLTDRRSDARFPPAEGDGTRATLRPGCSVTLVNLSAGGALLQAARPLRPGARVQLQLVTTRRTTVLPAHVLRCVVWALDRVDGATYRGAVQFEQRCDSIYETEASAAGARGLRRGRT